MSYKKTVYRIKNDNDNKNVLISVSIFFAFRLHKKSELGIMPYSDFFVRYPPQYCATKARKKDDFSKKNTTIYKNAYFCL